MSLVKADTSAHWYTDLGAPKHGANLRTARKESLLPSVTTVLKVWPKPILERWKVEQGILSALTLPRMAGEPDDAFARRVAEDMQDEVTKAAEVGSVLHNMLSTRLLSGKWPEVRGYQAWQLSYETWIQLEIKEVIASESVLVNKDLGYAGTVDLIAKTKTWGTAVLDFKSQNVKEGKPGYYETYAMQLAAYGKSYDGKVDNLVSVVLNRSAPDRPYCKAWKEDDCNHAWECFVAAMKLWTLSKKYYPTQEWSQ